jgi:Ca2+-binding EF-hand superfamily protein
MLPLFPATMAAGQFIDTPKNNAGDAPPRPAQAGQEGGPRGRGMMGPPNMMFSVIDADSDGKITARELRRAAVQLKKLDLDRDGNITLAEASPGGGPGGNPAQFIDGIMQSDKNGDGKLAAAEIPDHLKPMLANADQNGDGAIDRAELTAAMENMDRPFPGGPGPWRGGPGGGPGGFNQAPDPAQLTGRLMQNDSNGDGRLTTDEVPPYAMGMLQGADQNNDGAIDAAELQAATRRMGGRARAFGPGGPNERNGAGPAGRNGRGRERQRNENQRNENQRAEN